MRFRRASGRVASVATTVFVPLVSVIPIGAAPGVRLPGATMPAGVQYAAEQLQQAVQCPVTTRVGGRGLPDGLAGAGDEAFALAPEGEGFCVSANASAGLMYGLLELCDRIAAGAPPGAVVVSQPTLRLRGDVMDFPFYLGVDLYRRRPASPRRTG